MIGICRVCRQPQEVDSPLPDQFRDCPDCGRPLVVDITEWGAGDPPPTQVTEGAADSAPQVEKTDRPPASRAVKGARNV